jgi:hypothetical protein
MDVSDDVEWAVLRFAVVPKRASLNVNGVYFLRTGELEDVPDSLTFQPTKRAPELLRLVADDMRAKLTIRPQHVSILAEPLWEIEDNRFREDVVFLCKSDEGLPRLGLHICCVYDGEASASEPLTDDVVEKVKGITRRRLIVFVIRNQSTAKVRGYNLGRKKVLAGKR